MENPPNTQFIKCRIVRPRERCGKTSGRPAPSCPAATHLSVRHLCAADAPRLLVPGHPAHRTDGHGMACCDHVTLTVPDGPPDARAVRPAICTHQREAVKCFLSVERVCVCVRRENLVLPVASGDQRRSQTMSPADNGELAHDDKTSSTRERVQLVALQAGGALMMGAPSFSADSTRDVDLGDICVFL